MGGHEQKGDGSPPKGHRQGRAVKCSTPLSVTDLVTHRPRTPARPGAGRAAARGGSGRDRPGRGRGMGPGGGIGNHGSARIDTDCGRSPRRDRGGRARGGSETETHGLPSPRFRSESVITSCELEVRSPVFATARCPKRPAGCQMDATEALSRDDDDSNTVRRSIAAWATALASSEKLPLKTQSR